MITNLVFVTNGPDRPQCLDDFEILCRNPSEPTSQRPRVVGQPARPSFGASSDWEWVNRLACLKSSTILTPDL